MRGVLTCLESSKSRPSSQPPQRLRHLELHAFGASGSTFAMCPPKTLFAPPLFARLWRRRWRRHYLSGLPLISSSNLSETVTCSWMRPVRDIDWSFADWKARGREVTATWCWVCMTATARLSGSRRASVQMPYTASDLTLHRLRRSA